MSQTVSVYIRNSEVPMDENQAFEFKGHRGFSVENIKNKDKEGRPTKRPVSIAACGMLNSRRGGIIFMGVNDDGVVKGIMLNPFQQHHIILNIRDTFERYSPPVPDHLYQIKFVPVVEPGETQYKPPPLSMLHDPLQNPNLPHILRTHIACWCDRRSKAAIGNGLFYPFWVVELHIFPIDESDERTKNFLQTATWPDPDHKYFECEDGSFYKRENASTSQIFLLKES